MHLGSRCRIVLIMMGAAVKRTQRDWLVDALFFWLAIGFTTLAFIDGVESHHDPVTVNADAVLGGLASLGLWLRRRWPVGVAAVAGLLGVYSVSASGVALLALFTVAVHRRALTAILVAAAYALASLLTFLVRPDLPRPGGATAVLGVICVAAVLAWGMFVRSRRQLAQIRRDRATFEQEQRLAEVRQLERQRIAREMHDVLGHRLSLLSLHAGALQLWPDAPPTEIARAAGVISDTAHRALEDLREVIGVLRAGQLEGAPEGEAPQRPQPTLADLPALIDESRRAGTLVALECQVADVDALPDAIGRTAYRIVQEGLTNARKHAAATSVSVSVKGTRADGLTVEIRNPLAGNDTGTAAQGSRTGIIGLAERAELAGGRLEYGPTPAGDFRLRAWLPWPA
jgi:signal transduction histidine kinase